MPAPVKNTNARKHGLHSYLALGRLPRGCSYISRLVGRLRAELTRSVEATGRTVGVYEMALVNSAARHEIRAAMFGRYLRHEESLPVGERVRLLREIGNASDSRDKCIRQLRLDVPPPTSPWDGWGEPAPGVPTLTFEPARDAGDEALAILERDEAATLDLIDAATTG